MRTLAELLTELPSLDANELQAWVESRWVRPARVGAEYQFSDADVARVRLIWQIRYELGVEAETIPLVLSLLDQLYAARAQLHAFGHIVAEQPMEVRQVIEERFIAAIRVASRDDAAS